MDQGNEKKKGFFAKIMEKLDKKMEEKSRKGCSCCSNKKTGEDKDKCC